MAQTHSTDPIWELRERLRNEARPSEYRYLIGGALAALSAVAVILITRVPS